MSYRSPATGLNPLNPEGELIERSHVTKLIEPHVSYSHAIAAEVKRKLPPDWERKDIQGWAELGPVQAAHLFDARRGVRFKTFAYDRIKGAIYDGLRKMGWYPKGHYRQMRFEMATNEYLKDASADAPRSALPEDQLDDLRQLTGNLIGCYCKTSPVPQRLKSIRPASATRLVPPRKPCPAVTAGAEAGRFAGSGQAWW